MAPEPFPALLRRLRQARGWSQQRLADELCRVSGHPTVTRQEIYRWECGRRSPQWWLPHLALALEVPQTALERALAFPSTTETVLKNVLPAQPVPVAAAGGRSVGVETVDYFRHRVHALRRADDVIPGKDLIEPAFREFELAVHTAKEGTFSESVGRRLLSTVGELAQITGWIAHDAGQHRRAEDTYRVGLSASREAGDAVLSGQLLGTLGYGLSNTGSEIDGLALALAALDEAGDDAPPRTRALFWDRVAWGHTKVGDASAATRALGEAEQALGQHGEEDEPPWVYWVDANELAIMEARVFTELAKPLRAVPLLTDTLARYDPTHVREFTLYQSWLAVALTDANEPETAAHVLMQMLTASANLGSDRLAERTRVVLRKLEPHHGIAEVDAVTEVARAVGVC